MSVPPNQSQKPKPSLQVLADNDEDLDDLDDVLSQFTPAVGNTSQGGPLSPLTSPPPPPPTATTTTTFGRPRTNTRVDRPPVSVPGSGGAGLDAADELDEEALTSDFAKELAKGMEDLMKEISGGASADDSTAEPGSEEDEAAKKALKAAFEAMLIAEMNGMDVPEGQTLTDDGVKPGPSTAPGKTEDFQKKIRETMDRLKQSESSSSTQSGGPSATANPESLESLLSSLKDLGLDGEGGEDENELAGFLENMMGELMGKEVLYEPLTELAEKFPPYLANPPAPLEPEDRKRYESQLAVVRQIITVFDEPGYDANNPETGKKVVDLMSQMQSFGSPPEAVMGPLPPGLGFGADGMPALGEGCTVA